MFFSLILELSFFFLRGDVGETIRLDFPNNNRMARCFLVGLRSGLACTSLPQVDPSGNVSLYLCVYIIYIPISYYLFYPIITGYIAFITIGGHL